MFLHRRQLHHLVNIQINRAVGNLILQYPELGLHTFQLIAHLGKSLLQLDDVLNALRLFQQCKKSLLLRQQRFFVTLQIHILKGYIGYAFVAADDIGNLSHILQEFVQMLCRHTDGEIGISQTVPTVAAAVISITLLYVAPELLRPSSHVFQQLVEIFRLRLQIYIPDQLTGAVLSLWRFGSGILPGVIVKLRQFAFSLFCHGLLRHGSRFVHVTPVSQITAAVIALSCCRRRFRGRVRRFVGIALG